MIIYPSIMNSSKAARKQCIAFDKIDGSNFRAKYTSNKSNRGFDLFGSRNELIHESSNNLMSLMPEVFKKHTEADLLDIFKSKAYRHYREIIVFGEFVGERSFAGTHQPNDNYEIVVFDILLGHKERKLVAPRQFIKDFEGVVETPTVIYEGVLNDSFIEDVRQNKYNVQEGVICKGTESSGAFFGGIWQCKIKTNAYLEKLKNTFRERYIDFWK